MGGWGAGDEAGLAVGAEAKEAGGLGAGWGRGAGLGSGAVTLKEERIALRQ